MTLSLFLTTFSHSRFTSSIVDSFLTASSLKFSCWASLADNTFFIFSYKLPEMTLRWNPPVAPPAERYYANRGELTNDTLLLGCLAFDFLHSFSSNNGSIFTIRGNEADISLFIMGHLMYTYCSSCLHSTICGSLRCNILLLFRKFSRLFHFDFLFYDRRLFSLGSFSPFLWGSFVARIVP